MYENQWLSIRNCVNSGNVNVLLRLGNININNIVDS